MRRLARGGSAGAAARSEQRLGQSGNGNGNLIGSGNKNLIGGGNGNLIGGGNGNLIGSGNRNLIGGGNGNLIGGGNGNLIGGGTFANANGFLKKEQMQAVTQTVSAAATQTAPQWQRKQFR
ncbi:hypothetical protein MmiHf6_08750 [Methanimicrococcus hongohii]|uniref:Uncharacterized protein n=1 Tax=Methanimicrococcus hongohii TaxID=3028295 RepID=A0AA96V8V9_9EURY|nr:hypothetical protein MmiHf6_08750 [Methanimicrococcus sp. Hf6]